MPMRPSSDRPINDPLSRAGFVQKESIDGDERLGIVAFPGYGRQPAENQITERARVRSRWQQEAGVWTGRIKPADVPDEIVSGGMNVEVPGYPVSSAGIGERYADGPGRTYPGADFYAVWHPSGRAFWLLDTDGATIDGYRWEPGSGITGKYTPIVLSEASYDAAAFLAAYNSSTSFSYPFLSAGGGRIAISHDGRYLAFVGQGGSKDIGGPSVHANQVVVFRVDLVTGIDAVHPIVPLYDFDALGTANDVAWSHDGKELAVAFNGGVARFPWSGDYGGSFSGAPVEAAENGTFGDTLQIAYTPEDDYLIAGVDGGNPDPSPGTIQAWPVDTTAHTFGTILTERTNHPTDACWALAVHPSGNWVLFSSWSPSYADDGVWVMPLDRSGGGSWTVDPIEVDVIAGWSGGDDVKGGVDFNPAGSLIVARWRKGDGSGDELRAYSFDAGDGSSALLNSVSASTLPYSAQTFTGPKFRP